MKVLGIIAEYNPFHNGHKYHLEKSLSEIEPDCTVCVMSGNFTQRGEPAMADKWQRSMAAIKSGIDLVFELPFIYACNNSEQFARGSVDILNRIGCVTDLSFGSEVGELAALYRAADFLSNETEEFKLVLKEYTSKGLSYPKARCTAVQAIAGEETASVIRTANNILAVEYLKQLNISNSKIVPHTVKRFGNDYNDISASGNIASATAIRQILSKNDSIEEIKEYITKESYEVLKNVNSNVKLKINDFYQLLVYSIISKSTDQLGKIYSATEGLEHKLKKEVINSIDIDSFIGSAVSKRYTKTRIQRLLVHTLMDLNRDYFNFAVENKINYARVLAFNKKGAALLRHIKNNETSSIPIYTNINREVHLDSYETDLLSYDIKASDIYNMVATGNIYTHSDYVMRPFKDFA